MSEFDKTISEFDKTVPCIFCCTQTSMLGTKQCDNCHEILTRIKTTKLIALVRIIEEVYPDSFYVKFSLMRKSLKDIY